VRLGLEDLMPILWQTVEQGGQIWLTKIVQNCQWCRSTAELTYSQTHISTHTHTVKRILQFQQRAYIVLKKIEKAICSITKITIDEQEVVG
jgi:hypothetical protein